MPILAAAIPAVIGGVEAIFGSSKARKARSSLLNQQTPSVAPSKAINDYYQTALNRYAAGPYNTVGYNVQKNLNQQGLATGINAAQNRRQGVESAGALTQMFANNNARAGAQAEGQATQAFGQLGRAAGAKNANDQYTFGINSMLPYNKNRELYAAELGGANQIENAGIENIGSAFNNAASIGSANIRSGRNFWGKYPGSGALSSMYGGGGGGGGDWTTIPGNS